MIIIAVKRKTGSVICFHLRWSVFVSNSHKSHKNWWERNLQHLQKMSDVILLRNGSWKKTID